MNIKEAKQILAEQGYVLTLGQKLKESVDVLKNRGYFLVEESEDEFESNKEKGDFETSGENLKGKKNKQREEQNHENKESLKELVKELRDVEGYSEFVQHLKSLKPYQIQLLKQLVGNGKFAKNTVAEPGAIPVFLLHPTQNEIDIDNSLAFPLENKKGKGAEGIKQILESPKETITINDSPLLVYKYEKDYYIIDGHHRWSQVALMNRKAKMNIILFKKVPGENAEPVDVLKDFQAVVLAQTGEIKVATAKKGNNIYDKSGEELYHWVKEHTVKEAIEAWKTAKGHENDELEDIAKQIGENGDKLIDRNKPAPGAPPRNVMPQTDIKTAEIASDGMFNF